MNRLAALVWMAALTVSAASARADDFPGDASAGRDYAQRTCIECHSESRRAMGETARSFEEIADTPGMTATALIVWLTSTPHPTMPNLIVAPDDARNVVAYILGLKQDPGGTRTGYGR